MNHHESDNDTTTSNPYHYEMTVTGQELDAEAAATSVLENVQARHAAQRQVDGSERLVVHPQQRVQTQVSRLEAALRARRQYSASARHPSRLLQDMITTEDDSSVISHQNLHTQGDGLMKLSNETDESVRRLGLFQRRSPHNTVPDEATAAATRPGTHRLPLHRRDDSSSSSPNTMDGYVATTQEGYVQDYFLQETTSNASSYVNIKGRHSKRPGGHRGSSTNSFLPEWLLEICAMCHPLRMLRNIREILVQSHFFWIGIPALFLSALCYYYLDNPSFYFLPGRTTIAMWLLFIFRQTVTLGLARLTVYILVDGVMLGTHLAVRTLGPLITLAAATGKGWPAVMTTWGLWNLILVHGNTRFQLNWLYWTNIELFNLNVGGYLVNSVLYTRILAAFIIGGLVVSAKRTVFALRFGRKQVAEFRPRLKRVLADVCLLDEVSTAVEQALEYDEGRDTSFRSSRDVLNPSMVPPNLKELLWVPKIEYQASKDSDVDGPMQPIREDTSILSSEAEDASPVAHDAVERQAVIEFAGRAQRRSSSGLIKIKDMLYSWEEPESVHDKASHITIHEILKFRRALAHLDEENVFGDAFGSTRTRDDCIINSHRVYDRLLTLVDESKRSNVLKWKVLELLCIGDDRSSESLSKRKRLRKLFTPNRSGDLPLLAFIQAVDQCYKKVVFLRASLRNASLLDDVLERLFNTIFYFVLVLFLSSILQLHPWTLMVSITSLLVSVSFAFGSSVSAYVDGILLIAVRRPYDLGDRIYVSGADDMNPCPDISKYSWFVEDITLATTTLRFARTNEVCTVNNSSLASTRIVNLARSPNATIHMDFAAHVRILEDNKFEQFRKAMEKYVHERPRIWECVSHVRHGTVDVDMERVDLSVAVRHRCAWQEAGRIKNDTAAFKRYLYNLGREMKIHFTAPPGQNVVYQGGALKRGDTDDCDATSLLVRSNIRPLDIDPTLGAFRTSRG